MNTSIIEAAREILTEDIDLKLKGKVLAFVAANGRLDQNGWHELEVVSKDGRSHFLRANTRSDKLIVVAQNLQSEYDVNKIVLDPWGFVLYVNNRAETVVHVVKYYARTLQKVKL
jgi:ABC-type uncharacterized transport system permease subunit